MYRGIPKSRGHHHQVTIQTSNKAASAIASDHAGWLLKANPTGLIKKYKRRWFVLAGAFAYYYTSPQVRDELPTCLR